ncbi:metalloregulator ArsR/SmtB family transcription factor [Vibrio ruber]|uniref:HTH-type transcriptional repressor AseR n=1 Tax=Vibrio ruber (strain DSM 16370 / JCM 11486 / BCRC 17186 / CECT 7878 / LMG 23124 / VR1) TaxID=1123498 RepID=A0A1R4LPB4_VIBR1|nr:metalloregulator ArsR/SmtB family transcription factor [Vibrio ruber]WNJ95126.1 metalloregulator ArsR/SmtB family transcription factor [Vibrio ruber]SJN58229.1 HTH-type transcriptional repressor AseR [Vibrio ruber DSM 16370]
MTPLQFFKCLSDDTRLKSILIIHQLEEACVCDLMAALELDQPKVSRHLAELRKCNILRDERRGKWVYYQLHEQLPDWAKTVIRQTADSNPSYFADALSKLKAAKQQASCC